MLDHSSGIGAVEGLAGGFERAEVADVIGCFVGVIGDLHVNLFPAVEDFGLGKDEDGDGILASCLLELLEEGVEASSKVLPVFKLSQWTDIVSFFSHLRRFCQDLKVPFRK